MQKGANYVKNITEQIENLQHENERLKELDKLFEKAVKNYLHQ